MSNKRLANCRVCGKEFSPCKTCYAKTGKYNWREMCCSPECGQQYLEAVIKARNPVEKLTKDSKDIENEVIANETKSSINKDKSNVISKSKKL